MTDDEGESKYTPHPLKEARFPISLGILGFPGFTLLTSGYVGIGYLISLSGAIITAWLYWPEIDAYRKGKIVGKNLIICAAFAGMEIILSSYIFLDKTHLARNPVNAFWQYLAARSEERRRNADLSDSSTSFWGRGSVNGAPPPVPQPTLSQANDDQVAAAMKIDNPIPTPHGAREVKASDPLVRFMLGAWCTSSGVERLTQNGSRFLYKFANDPPSYIQFFRRGSDFFYQGQHVHPSHIKRVPDSDDLVDETGLVELQTYGENVTVHEKRCAAGVPSSSSERPQ